MSRKTPAYRKARALLLRNREKRRRKEEMLNADRVDAQP